MVSSCRSNFRYLRTPMGAVKVLNVLFGVTSVILVVVSYVPMWTLDVFLGTVATCLLFSLVHIAVYLWAGADAIHSRANRVTSFIFHVLAGAALIVAGIELIGWSEYKNPSCKHECPKLYTVGVAKTLTFMNGTLYLIVAFLGVKDDDLLDPEQEDEDIPLLNSTVVLSRFPGGSKQSLAQSLTSNVLPPTAPAWQQSLYYDNFMRQPGKLPGDTRSYSSSYRNRPSQPQFVEYSFNNSYASANSHHYSHYGGTKVAAGEGKEKHKKQKERKHSTSIKVNMASSATSADLQLVRG